MKRIFLPVKSNAGHIWGSDKKSVNLHLIPDFQYYLTSGIN